MVLNENPSPQPAAMTFAFPSTVSDSYSMLKKYKGSFLLVLVWFQSKRYSVQYLPGILGWTSRCRGQGCTAYCWRCWHSASNCTGPSRSCTFWPDWCGRCTGRWDCTGHELAGCAARCCTVSWLCCCTGNYSHWYWYWCCWAMNCTTENKLKVYKFC